MLKTKLKILPVLPLLAVLTACCHNPVVSQPAPFKVGVLADPCAATLPTLTPESNASEQGFLEWISDSAAAYRQCRDSKAALVKVLQDNKVIEATKP